jgi:hypothetical protein
VNVQRTAPTLAFSQCDNADKSLCVILPAVAVCAQTTFAQTRVSVLPVKKMLMLVMVLGMWLYAPCVQADVPFVGSKEEQQITAEEEKIQAAFIWQFLQFIEFPAPASQQEPFVIGVVGSTRVEMFLSDILKQKQFGGGRVIELRKITNIDDVVRCNAVFIAPAESVRLAQILGKTRGNPILTIGRDETLLEKGGLVNFYVESAKVRFEYNADEIPASKLRFSSKLLRLGREFTKK